MYIVKLSHNSLAWKACIPEMRRVQTSPANQKRPFQDQSDLGIYVPSIEIPIIIKLSQFLDFSLSPFPFYLHFRVNIIHITFILIIFCMKVLILCEYKLLILYASLTHINIITCIFNR